MKAATLLLAALVAGSVSAQAPKAPALPKAGLPTHPDQLRFKPIEYTPPAAKDYRSVLSNGMVVYIAEDRAVPLVNIALLVRTGSYLEPVGKEGLAALTGAQIRRGGSKSLSAEALDEKLEFLAAQAQTGIAETSGMASLNCLADNLDEVLPLFVEMVREPRFQEDRLKLALEQQLQELKKRNDDSADIEAREWRVLLHGEKHFTNRFVTQASLASITRADLVAFQRRYFHPANMIASVSGSFSKAEMLAKLEAAFANWPGDKEAVPPVPSELADTAGPRLYRIQKEVNQGRVSIGLPGVRRSNPDVYALEVMNEILGGSGFAARITKTVRSDEGLAYVAGSSIAFGPYYPGSFHASFQSKSRSVAYAAQLVLGEIQKMRTALVTAEELDTMKKSLIESFPSNFASKAHTLSVLAADEYTRREPDYWTTYRERIAAVTAADVQRVAQQYLVPEKLIWLVVGDQKEIDLGDPKHPVKLADLVEGKVTDLPLRDPLTMKRP